MNSLILAPMRRLADSMADLRVRVREALAGELSRIVSETVREVVAALVRGEPREESLPHHDRRNSPGRWKDDPDPWDPDPYWEGGPRHPDADDDDTRSSRDRPRPADTITTEPSVPVLLPQTRATRTGFAAGIAASRWWLRRRGSMVEALGVGLLVAVAVMTGGPVAWTGAAVVTTATDLCAGTECLPIEAFHHLQS